VHDRHASERLGSAKLPQRRASKGGLVLSPVYTIQPVVKPVVKPV